MDVNYRRLWVAIFLGLLTVPATHPTAAGDVAPAQAAVEGLSLEADGAGCAVGLRTSTPVPRFALKPAGVATAEVTLELPDSTSRLQDRYAPGPCPLRDVVVETDSNGGRGVRIRFALASGGAFSALEQTGQGIRLRFGLSRDQRHEGSVDLAEYKIGVGDKLEIVVFGHEDLKIGRAH